MKSLIYALSVITQNNIIPADMIESFGFAGRHMESMSRTMVGRFDASFTGVDRDRTKTINIEYFNDIAPKHRRPAKSNAKNYSFEPLPPSGLPLGFDFQFVRTPIPPRTIYKIAIGYGSVQVDYGYLGRLTRPRGPSAFPEPRWSDWDGWVEGVVRIVVGRGVARRLDPTGSTRLGSSDIGTVQCRFSERKYYKLRDWAAARS